MAKRFLNNININDQYTFPSTDGSAGQAIITDGAGNLTFGSAIAASADSAESIHISVKNTSGAQILKGTPVYVTGETGNSGKIEVAPADASDSAKMPALGLLESTLNNNGEGFCVQGGLLEGLATATIDGTATTANDTVYVKSGGGLTMTKPTGTGLIQNIAKVARAHGSNGTLVVSSILRTNDVPNLTTGKIWVGDGNTVESTVVHLDEVNGRMGIGTTTPAEDLHVVGDTRTTRFILTDSGDVGRLTMQIDSNDDTVITTGTTTGTRSLLFLTEAAERMRIDSSGNVGIGTTSPGYKLDVNGSAQIKDYIRITNASGGQRILLGNQDSGGVDNPSVILAANGNTYIGGGNSWSGNGGTLDYTATFTDAGKVGIGTTSPGFKLQVTGDGSFENRVRVVGLDTGNPAVSVDHVHLSGYGLAGNRGGFYITNQDNGGNIQFGIGGVHAANTKMYINSDGNVGIGTTSPSEKLEVAGKGLFTGTEVKVQNASDPSIQVSDTDANYKGAMRWLSSDNVLEFYTRYAGTYYTSNLVLDRGNVGIGTTSPSEKLNVDGNILATGTILGSNLSGTNTGDQDLSGYLLLNGGTMTGNLTLSYAYPRINLYDTDNDSDYSIINNDGSFSIYDATNNSHRLSIAPGGNATFAGAIAASNFSGTSSGTNTGDQDLSGYALTSHNHNLWDLTATRSGINIDTVGSNNFWDYIHGTSTSDGTHVGSYQYIVSFGDKSQGIQLSHTFGGANNGLYFRSGSDNPSSENGANNYKNWRRILTTSDEGSGNGLDADTLDGQHASNFATSTHNHDGTYLPLTAGSSHPLTGNLYIEGADKSLRINNGTQPVVFLGDGGANTDGQLILYNSSGDVNIVLSGDNQNHYITNGNVGIGTTSPASRLEIGGTTGSYNSGIGFAPAGTGARTYRTFIGTNGSFNFDDATAGSTRINISANGNVGIGTTSPSENLEVAGSVRVGNMKFEPSSAGRIGFNRNTTNGVIYDSNYAAFQINGPYSGADFFEIQNYNSSGAFQGSVVIKEGNVGIGTTSPAYKLHVSGNAYINETLFVNQLTTIEDSLIVYDNVGIGTTAPGTKLHVSSSENGNWTTTFQNTVNSNSHTVYTAYSNSSNNARYGVYISGTGTTSGDYHLLVNDQFAVVGSGDVGIGTISPGYKLDVFGTARIKDYNDLILNGVSLKGYPNKNLWLIGNESTNVEYTIGTSWNWDLGVSFKYTPYTIGNQTGFLQIGQLQKNSNDWTHGVTSFYVAGSEKMRINNTGNVGIGTTTPAVRLDFGSSVGQAFHLYTSGVDYYGINMTQYDSGPYSTNVISGNGGQIKFRTATGTSTQTTRMTITSSGSVGIGTTSPGYTLDVNGSLHSTSLTIADAIYHEGDTNTYIQFVSNDTIRWVTNGSERMRLNSSGNFGIGTTSPGAKFHVNGTGLFSDNTSINAEGKYFQTAGSFTWGGSTTLGVRMGTDGLAGLIDFRRWLGSGTLHHVAAVRQVVGGSGRYGLGFLADDISTNSQATTVRMYIDPNSGYIGIGTDSPDYPLHVVRNIANFDVGLFVGNQRAYGLGDFSGGALYLGKEESGGNQVMGAVIGRPESQDNSTIGTLIFQTRTSGAPTEKMRISSSGNVGIGTTNPASTLDVNGMGQFTVNANGVSTPLKLINNSTTGTVVAKLAFQNNGVVKSSINSAVYNEDFLTFNVGSDTERMRISAAGNVGIGTTNPLAKLHTKGNILSYTEATNTASLFIAANNTDNYQLGMNNGSQFVITHGGGLNGLGTEFLRINTGGNVSIGNTNNTYKLDVSGAGRFTSTVTATNFILSSDKTLKDNISDINTDHIDVKWKNFELKSEPGVKRAGVIAQELEEKHPEFVRTDKDGVKSVAYIDLLIAKIAELEARLEKLEK